MDNKTRWTIKHFRYAEISLRDYAFSGHSVINAFVANGLNGDADVLGTVGTYAEACAELEKHRCSANLTSGNGNKFYSCEFYFAAEEEYDPEYDEWSDSGNYEFAEMEG